MSKKDYQAIAGAFYRLQPEPAHSNDPDKRSIDAMRGVWFSLRAGIESVLAANPRFDRERFVQACETGSCKGMRPVR